MQDANMRRKGRSGSSRPRRWASRRRLPRSRNRSRR